MPYKNKNKINDLSGFKKIILDGKPTNYFVDTNGHIASGYSNTNKFKAHSYIDKMKSPRCFIYIDEVGSKNIPVDRIVAEAFVPNPHHYNYLIHLNYDMTNVHAYNLCWVDRKTWRHHISETSYRTRNEDTSRFLDDYDAYVTTTGKVRSLKLRKNSYLHQFKRYYGYLVIIRSEEDKYISVDYLIAKAFVPNPNHFKYIKHLNHNVFDNHAKNLAWCDYDDMIINNFFLGKKVFKGYRMIRVNGQLINYVINKEGHLRSLFSQRQSRGVQEYYKHYFKVRIRGHQYRKTGEWLWNQSIPNKVEN